jgi:DNA-binding CsgD family transcriptional regulator
VAERLLPVIERLYAAVAEPAAWSAAMEGVVDLLSSDHAFLRMGTGPIAEANDLVSGRADIAELARRQAAYEAKNAKDLLISRGLGMLVGSVTTRDLLITDRDYARHAHYNEVVRHIGGFHAVFASDQRPGASYLLAVCRPHNRSNFDRDDTARLRRLMPHLMNATTLRNRLGTIELQGASLAGVLDRLSTALILVDAAGGPIFVNQAARRMSLEGGLPHLRGDGRAAATEMRRLRQAIAAASAGPVAEVRTVRLARTPDQRPVMATVLPVARLDLALPGCRAPHAAVFLTGGEAATTVDRASIATVLDLTPREAEVAALIAEGMSLNAIAAHLRLGRGTVNSHLKRVFDKTGTHSQAALAVLIGRFTKPIV